jgi:hypothetical protein
MKQGEAVKFDQFFPRDMAQEIYDYIQEQLYSPHNRWAMVVQDADDNAAHNLKSTDYIIMVHHIDENDIDLYNRIESMVNHLIAPYTDLVMDTAMVYAFRRGNGFPWHNDKMLPPEYYNREVMRIRPENRFGTLTMYMNKDWEEEWGGLFGYIQDGKTSFIRPDFNTAMMISSDIQHKVTPVTPPIPKQGKEYFRTSIQFWLKHV